MIYLQLWWCTSELPKAVMSLDSAHPTPLIPGVLGVWPFFLVVSNPAADDRSGLAQRLEPILPNALFLQGPEKALNEPVLLRRVGRREFLGEPVGLHRPCIVSAAEDVAIIGAQGQRLMDTAQCAESMHQSLFQHRFSGLAAAVVR